jgi:hypothetical protein
LFFLSFDEIKELTAWIFHIDLIRLFSKKAKDNMLLGVSNTKRIILTKSYLILFTIPNSKFLFFFGNNIIKRQLKMII